ncbi:hypothetical protein KW787_02500 [Candidatus Pacearchaeota archaeon]|nr:hypothetical protein [Candidatus Pacearchaeota archaeon]
MSSTDISEQNVGQYLKQKLGGKLSTFQGDICDRLELENIDVQSANHIIPLIDEYYGSRGFTPTNITKNSPDHRVYMQEGSDGHGIRIMPNPFERRLLLEIYFVKKSYE